VVQHRDELRPCRIGAELAAHAGVERRQAFRSTLEHESVHRAQQTQRGRRRSGGVRVRREDASHRSIVAQGHDQPAHQLGVHRGPHVRASGRLAAEMDAKAIQLVHG